MSLIPFWTTQKPNSKQMVHNSYIFININSSRTSYSIASKKGNILAKSAIFYKAMVNTTYFNGYGPLACLFSETICIS